MEDPVFLTKKKIHPPFVRLKRRCPADKEVQGPGVRVVRQCRHDADDVAEDRRLASASTKFLRSLGLPGLLERWRRPLMHDSDLDHWPATETDIIPLYIVLRPCLKSFPFFVMFS